MSEKLIRGIVDVISGADPLREAKKFAARELLGPKTNEPLVDSLVDIADRVDRNVIDASDALVKGFRRVKDRVANRHMSTLPMNQTFEGPGSFEAVNPGLTHSKANKLIKMVTGNGPRKAKGKGKGATNLSTILSPNPAVGFVYNNSPPKIRMSSDGESCTYTHVEPFPHVQSLGTDFLLSTVNVNPGLSRFSRWLPGIASRFEYYQFKSLDIIYEPAVGTTRDGNVCVCFDPEQDTVPPDSMETMLYMQDSKVGTPWAPFTLSVSKKNLYQRKTFRVRTNELPIDGSPEIYDVGNIHFATFGVSAGYIGRLFIRYEIQFSVSSSKFIYGGGLVTSFIGSSASPPPSNDILRYVTSEVLMPNGVSFVDDVVANKVYLRIHHPGFFLVTINTNGVTGTNNFTTSAEIGVRNGLNYPVAGITTVHDSLYNSNQTTYILLISCKPATVNGFLFYFSQTYVSYISTELTVSTITEESAAAMSRVRNNSSSIYDDYEHISKTPSIAGSTISTSSRLMNR